MYPLFETIAVENFQPKNLWLHQQRMNNSYRDIFGGTNPFILSEIFKKEKITSSELLKWNVWYAKESFQTKVSSYAIRKIDRVKLVSVDSSFDYSHKFSNRLQLEQIRNQFLDYDDIIIVKNGLITDSSYANIVLQKDDKLFTPRLPLLFGTQRKYLIENQIIIEKDIHPSEIAVYEKMYFINAMLTINIAPFVNINTMDFSINNVD
jgi:4-amino-4-deoxychorismate lyase